MPITNFLYNFIDNVIDFKTHWKDIFTERERCAPSKYRLYHCS